MCVCMCVFGVECTQKWTVTCPHKCEWLTMEGPNNVLLFQWLLHYLIVICVYISQKLQF